MLRRHFTMRHRSHLVARLFALTLLALMPMLAIGGSGASASMPPSAPTQQREAVVIFRVYFNSMAERNWLATEFGADEHQTLGGYLTFTANQQLHDTIKGLGFRVEIDEEATRQINIVVNTPSVPGTFYGGYRTVEEMESFLDQKVAANPTLAEKVDIGDSWCKLNPGQCTQPNSWNGFDLWVLRITNRNIPGPKPIFWYDSGIHSREIATPEVAMRFIDYLLNNYNGVADARWLVDHHEIWVMPMLNPDGHHMVEAGGNNPFMQRKNGNRTLCSTWPPPGIGIDLNRNFPTFWGCCGGSSGAACSETYRGPSAASEPETQAVVAKIRQVFPDQRGPNNGDPAPLDATGIAQSMHSVANLNLYPWGWTNTDSPNHADLDNIARHMSAPNAFPPGNNYDPCQPGECLYNVDGDSFDFQYGELGIPGYTTELSGGSFFPPYTQVESIWNENRGMLLYMAKIARTPYLLTRGPDTANPATNPMTTTQGSPVALTATMNYVWNRGSENNRYTQNVGGAEYYIGTPPWAGGTGIPMQAVDGAFDEQTEPVQATIDTSTIPPGTYVIYVRGRGVNDYGGLGSWGAFTATWLTVTSGGGSTPTVVPATSTPGGATATATVSCAVTTVDVAIVDFAFNPQVVTVAPGSTVRWTNNGQAPHTSTSTTALWDSGTLNTGQQFSYTFTTPGTYQYICTIHPSMTGTVIVSGGCPTATVVVPTLPATATRTPTSPASTSTRTITALPATNTVGVPPPTNTRTPVPATGTAGVATSSATSMATIPVGTGTAMATSTTMATATPCTLTFTDVPPTDPFYADIRCLACRGIISGYADGTFRPYNSITRGQIAKMVSNAAGFTEPVGGQTYEDVLPTNTFYEWIERLSSRGHMGGYPCGQRTTEPCNPPENRPYFRPVENATRGQLSKIVSNAAGFTEPVTGQFYTDVEESNPFYVEIMRLTQRGVMSGYPCGGPGEPCDPQNRPYFRWANPVTRGQASKIVANAFYPNCQTP
jgi:carboxypeptidase T